jgi:hypothetical protein
VSQVDLNSEASRALALRYLEHALGVKPDVPWRLAAKLLRTGLFSIEEQRTSIDELIIRAATDELSNRGVEGPSLFLFFNAEGGSSTKSFVELGECLGVRNISVAREISPLIAKAVRRYSSLSGISETLEAYQESIESEELLRIVEASAALADALANDWQWQVAILSEAVSKGIPDVALRQVSSLLRVDPIEPELLNSLQSSFADTLAILAAEQVTTLVTIEGARQQLDRLGPHVGHLPWGPNAGFCTVLGSLPGSGVEATSLWPHIAQWLSDDRPAWWFHVWLTAMMHPAGVPEFAWPDIWNRISKLVANMPSENSALNSENWRVVSYERLHKFFFYRIEAALQTPRPDFSLWAASKLASDLVAALGAQPNEAIDRTIAQANEDAYFVWSIVSPSISNELREAFLDFKAYWPVAILASAKEWHGSGMSGKIPAGIRLRLSDLVRRASVLLCTSTGFNNTVASPLLLTGMAQIPDDWLTILDADGAVDDWMKAYQHLTRVLERPGDVIDRFMAPMNHDDIERIIALVKWSKSVKSGEIALERALEMLTDDKWISAVEPTLNTADLEHMVFGILGAPWIGRETIRIEIAHWAATRCIATLGDPERRYVYYIATVLFSLKGGTSSAIDRLKHEDDRGALREDRERLNVKLEGILPASPSWMRGRIGSVLASSGL